MKGPGNQILSEIMSKKGSVQEFALRSLSASSFSIPWSPSPPPEHREQHPLCKNARKVRNLLWFSLFQPFLRNNRLGTAQLCPPEVCMPLTSCWVLLEEKRKRLWVEI